MSRRSWTACSRRTRRRRQRAFLAALGAIQAESTARYGRPWLGLEPEQKAELLTAASAGPPSREPRHWTPGQPVLVPAPPPAPPTLRDRFDLLKERIATAYYSSEAGMKELGWTGHLIHEAFPGCPHPEGHGLLGRGARQFARMRFCASWQELQAPLVTAAVMARVAPVVPVTSV